jgi:hypothetical protein
LIWRKECDHPRERRSAKYLPFSAVCISEGSWNTRGGLPALREMCLSSQLIVGSCRPISKSFGTVDIAAAGLAYTGPLQRACQDLLRESPPAKVVLLGSVATGKYVDHLLDAFGDSLVFPSDFVGRGDMSRGALLLRAAASGTELTYQPVKGAVRRGSRAPRVGPKGGSK